MCRQTEFPSSPSGLSRPPRCRQKTVGSAELSFSCTSHGFCFSVTISRPTFEASVFKGKSSVSFLRRRLRGIYSNYLAKVEILLRMLDSLLKFDISSLG